MYVVSNLWRQEFLESIHFDLYNHILFAYAISNYWKCFFWTVKNLKHFLKIFSIPKFFSKSLCSKKSNIVFENVFHFPLVFHYSSIVLCETINQSQNEIALQKNTKHVNKHVHRQSHYLLAPSSVAIYISNKYHSMQGIS